MKYFQVQEKYAGHEDEWRYELRVRYIPTDLKDLFEKDKVTFYYYYDQVSLYTALAVLPFKSDSCKALIDLIYKAFRNEIG